MTTLPEGRHARFERERQRDLVFCRFSRYIRMQTRDTLLEQIAARKYISHALVAEIPFLVSKLGVFLRTAPRPTTASRQCAESRAAVKLSTVRDEGRDLVKTPGARGRCCFCSSRRAAPLQTRRRLHWSRPSPSHREWSPPRNGGSIRCVVQIASRNVIAPRTTSALRSQNSQGSRCRTGAGRPVRPSPLQMPRSPPALS